MSSYLIFLSRASLAGPCGSLAAAASVLAFSAAIRSSNVWGVDLDLRRRSMAGTSVPFFRSIDCIQPRANFDRHPPPVQPDEADGQLPQVIPGGTNGQLAGAPQGVGSVQAKLRYRGAWLAHGGPACVAVLRLLNDSSRRAARLFGAGL